MVEEDFVGWPTLGQLRLGRAALDERSAGIGGSDANVLLSGNGERIRQLWLEKRGEAEPADLSANMAVMLGSWTEPFNRLWFEKDNRPCGGRSGDIGPVPAP